MDSLMLILMKLQNTHNLELSHIDTCFSPISTESFSQLTTVYAKIKSRYKYILVVSYLLKVSVIKVSLR